MGTAETWHCAALEQELEYIYQPEAEMRSVCDMQVYRTNHRPIDVYRRYAASRVALVFVAAMCFAQVASVQHIHALDDIDQTCVTCRFSDSEDILVSSSVETDTPLQFYEQQTEHCARVRVEASFGYEARAPPFSSYD